MENDKPKECIGCKDYETDCMRLPCSECERINTLYDNYEPNEKKVTGED